MFGELDLMSNCDHQVNRDVENRLRNNPGLVAGYPGWDFHGNCWYSAEENKWCCEVWCYGQRQEVMKADSPEELMEVVSEKYGHN